MALMKQIWAKLVQHWPLIFLIFVVTLLFFANYLPGTWLSGWDTLHPEWNLGLYFRRTFFGAWQETYGLGAVSIQAFAAELPRLLVILPLTMFLQASDVRYGYFFLTLCFSALGAYYFISGALNKGKALSVIGAIFYILNPGALQIFALPFEMNITFFAALPWLLALATKYLEERKKKYLMWFLVATFFASPMAHTPTLFITYFVALFLYLAAYIAVIRKEVKTALLILTATILINSFWLLPTSYFVVTRSAKVAESKINLQFSDDLLRAEAKVGTVENTLTLKNIFFDWGEYSLEKMNFVPLLGEWREYTNSTHVRLIEFIFVAILGLGILAAFIEKNHYGIALFPVFIFAFCFLANGQWPLSLIFEFFGEKAPILKELLRFTLTKFMTLLVFPYTIYLVLGTELVTRPIRRWVKIIPLAVMVVLIVTANLPAFKGQYIDPKMRVNFPSEYFSTISWLNDQDDWGRVTIFPVQSYWAWSYYRWGYEGAGFWWFGLDKPLLNREFDRWSPYNENYYWEISRAVYSQDLDGLEKIIDKYGIRWLVIDRNMISPNSPKSLYDGELRNMLGKSDKIRLSRVFGNIEVYEVLAQEKDQPVMVGSNLPTVGPKYKWNDNDVAYKDFGDYVVSGNPNTTYQNRSLFTRTPVAGDFPGTLGSPLMVIDPQNAGGPNCDNGASQNSMIGAGWVSLSSKDTNNCGAYIPLSDLPNRKAYLIKFKAENVSGKPLLFWVENLNSRRIDSQSYLPKDSTETSYYFVQPPMEEYGSGYALHFDNISVGQEKTINKLGTIEVYAIDYDLLIHSATQKNNMTGRAVFTTDKIKVEKLNPSLYKVDFKNPPSAGDHLVLFQAHDPGWVAVGLDSHVLIDNWTNGWTLTGKEKNLFIVFWPQTFIYIGLIILFVTVLVFILI